MGRRKLTDEEKAVVKAKEDADREESNLKRSLQDLREGFHSTSPTRTFKVGDRVDWSDNAVVEEVLDNGLIYLIRCKGMRKQERGDKMVPYNTVHYVAWTDINAYISPEENEKRPRFVQPEDLRLQFMNFQVESLLHKYYGHYAGVDMNPEYQRDLVWDLEDKQSLINSIFNHIDIGKFVFIKRNESFQGKYYEILDGKQRLSALIEYYEDRFRYNGRLFSELHWRDQAHILGFSISVAETRANDVTEDKKYRYFLKLNTTGKPQDPKHIAYVQGLLNKKEVHGN